MGMDLIGPKRHFQWNNLAWVAVLDVALEHGWQLMGICNKGFHNGEHDQA
jgi:hypothetical protein